MHPDDHRNLFGVVPSVGDASDLRNDKTPHVARIKAIPHRGSPAFSIRFRRQE